MAKTIKEIADEIGVSKQAVYKRYKGKLSAACAPYAYVEYGVVYLDEQGETIIKQDFAKSIGAHTERSVCALEKLNENADPSENVTEKSSQTAAKESAYTEQSNEVYTEHIRSTPYVQEQSEAIIKVLQATIDTLQGQLDIKDRQIERQATTIENLSASLAAAQALHAGTIPQQLTAGEKQDADEDQTVKPENKGRGFLSRFFGSKN